MFSRELKVFLTGAFIATLFVSKAYAMKEVVFCVDNSYFRYTMMDKKTNEVSGIAVDMAKYVLNEMNLKGNFQYTPWSRCTDNKSTSAGEYDGVVAPSYNKARGEFMNYPPGTEQSAPCKSPYSINCTRYAFIVPKNSTYDYLPKINPNAIADLPQPVRAPSGASYAIEIDTKLKASNKPGIDFSINSITTLLKIMRDKNGSAIMDYDFAKMLFNLDTANSKILREELKFLDNAYTEKSNYIAFYKSSRNMSAEEQKIFWEKLAALLNNKEVLKKIVENPKYNYWPE